MRPPLNGVVTDNCHIGPLVHSRSCAHTASHTDNFGLTFLICFELDEEGSLVGGSHAIFDDDYGQCVVVKDCPEGTVRPPVLEPQLWAISSLRPCLCLLLTQLPSVVGRVAGTAG